MKKNIKEKYIQKRERIMNMIEKIDNQVKPLLDEPRSMVANILNDLYNEKELLLVKLNEVDKIIASIDKNEYKHTKVITVKVNNKTKKLVIVDEELVDPRNGYISVESPIAKAVEGKNPGDTFDLSSPMGIVRYTLIQLA